MLLIGNAAGMGREWSQRVAPCEGLWVKAMLEWSARDDRGDEAPQLRNIQGTQDTAGTVQDVGGGVCVWGGQLL